MSITKQCTFDLYVMRKPWVTFTLTCSLFILQFSQPTDATWDGSSERRWNGIFGVNPLGRHETSFDTYTEVCWHSAKFNYSQFPHDDFKCIWRIYVITCCDWAKLSIFWHFCFADTFMVRLMGLPLHWLSHCLTNMECMNWVHRKRFVTRIKMVGCVYDFVHFFVILMLALSPYSYRIPEWDKLASSSWLVCVNSFSFRLFIYLDLLIARFLFA